MIEIVTGGQRYVLSPVQIHKLVTAARWLVNVWDPDADIDEQEVDDAVSAIAVCLESVEVV